MDKVDTNVLLNHTYNISIWLGGRRRVVTKEEEVEVGEDKDKDKDTDQD